MSIDFFGSYESELTCDNHRHSVAKEHKKKYEKQTRGIGYHFVALVAHIIEDDANQHTDK
jgi:hypothetical protein